MLKVIMFATNGATMVLFSSVLSEQDLSMTLPLRVLVLSIAWMCFVIAYVEHVDLLKKIQGK